MGLRTEDFLATTLDTASGYGVELSITQANGAWIQVAASQPTIEGVADLSTIAEVSLAGRVWRLRIAASGTALAPRRR
jgi:hypothetical protein